MAAILLVVLAVRGFRDPAESAKVTAARIADDEAKAHAAWKAIRASSGPTWDAAEVERVEREVLPPWSEARRRVEAARSGPDGRFFPPELEEFFRLREESWVALIEAVRQNDAERFNEHAELFKKAEEVGELVRSGRQPVVTLGR